jgi:hypothetical protein
VRFRRVKPQYASAADDRAAKLRLFDFPLNPQPGAACRAIELPSGKQVRTGTALCLWWDRSAAFVG